MEIVIDMISSAWHIFQESAIFMLFGFFIAGMLHVFFNADRIGRLLGKGNIRPVFLSSLVGIPIPLCSCGVVPAAASLYQKGANKGATMSFLISTPESGVDSISVTWALLGPVMAIIRPVAGFCTAIIAGITENVLGNRKEQVSASFPSIPCSGGCSCSCGEKKNSQFDPIPVEKKTSFWKKTKDGLRYAFSELLGDVGKWFVIGVILAGIIDTFIPDETLRSLSENRFHSMLAMIGVGVPMYICATSSTPIAAALMAKGLDPGSALVFLLVGPATNIATMSMVSGLLGKRSLLIYLVSIIVSAVGIGFLVNLFFSSDLLFSSAVFLPETKVVPESIEITASFILAVLLIASSFGKWMKRSGKMVEKKSKKAHPEGKLSLQ